MTVMLKFKGLTISKSDFEEKYSVQLSDIEWQALASNVNRTWEDQVDQLRLLAFKHIKNGMHEIGYKPKLIDNEIAFNKMEID
jgi:hypothetical protein